MGGPWAVLLVSIIAWTVMVKLVLVFGSYEDPASLSVVRSANVVLGFISILSIVAVPVGLIVGIVLLLESKSKSL